MESDSGRCSLDAVRCRSVGVGAVVAVNPVAVGLFWVSGLERDLLDPCEERFAQVEEFLADGPLSTAQWPSAPASPRA
jgi:hypothetical protein